MLLAFLGIALFFLATEHRAHLFGALPFLLVLLCPLLHPSRTPAFFPHIGGARVEQPGT